MEKGSSRGKKKGRSFKDRLGIFGPAILITFAGFIVAYQFVEPAPPRKISIGTGDSSGAYYAFAQRYLEILAQEAITLEIRSTAGSVENIKLLEAKERGVDIAFVQGGIGDPTAQTGLRSLFSLYYEPLWVFSHRSLQIKRLPNLQGKRIAVGPEESGVNAIATKLLAANGVTPQQPLCSSSEEKRPWKPSVKIGPRPPSLSSLRSLLLFEVFFHKKTLLFSASKGEKPINEPIASSPS